MDTIENDLTSGSVFKKLWRERRSRFSTFGKQKRGNEP